MSFVEILNSQNLDAIKNRIHNLTSDDVVRVLAKRSLSLEDFITLISPAAAEFQTEIVNKATQLTRQRFGNILQMYAPLYLSNECSNVCTYCGFSFHNKIERKVLTDAELIAEAEIVYNMGFRHILLVSGESRIKAGVDYFVNAISILKKYFSQISLEVQPLETHEYQKLIQAGLHSVLVYQETYDQKVYKEHHLKGRKANFEYRLDTPERLGNAGIHKIGLGVLLGLANWRLDAYCLALQLAYLKKKFWRTKFSISFPRIRPAEGVNIVSDVINDEELSRLACAYRLYDPNVELSLSTREPQEFRNYLMQTVFTSTSAGSKTEPGGYSNSAALKQFEIADERQPHEVAAALVKLGFEPVWKDWDHW